MDNSFIILHRKILESDLYGKPPHYREIFLYLLLKAFFVDGKKLKRGQLITSYKQIIEDLSWSVGYRKQAYKKHQCEKSMKWLMKAGMIETTKTTRGLVVTICNYSDYQDNKINESDSEGTTKATRKRQCGDTIDNKSNNNNNNNKYIISLSDGDLDLKSFPEVWKKHFPTRPLKSFSETRVKKLRLAVEKHGLNTNKKLNNYLTFCASVDWMNGKGSKRWFAGFDFLMKPETLTKAFEGSYGQINDELEPIKTEPEHDEDLINFFEDKLNGI